MTRTTINKHRVTQAKWVKEQLIQNQRLLSLAVDNVPTVPGNLSSILGVAAKLTDFGSAVPTDSEMLRNAIHLGAQAGLALMKKALGGDGPVLVEIGDGPPVACLGHL